MHTLELLENRKLIVLGTVTIFLFMILCGSTIILSWGRGRTTAQFPGSELIADHSKYKLPKLYRWDDTYATQAPMDQVYGWYSITFELGPEKQANGNCSLLEDVKTNLLAERYFGVLICEMGEQRLMFVTRATKLFP
ncbi:MAG: hypothetical protein ACI9EW_000632 [Cellvibrionaceae bacterium]|jgi:hypothetical protein